ncbi:MAG: hypothetical protein HYT39_04005 [Candidatus Sungbacteria bacterium]|nr:hypothetical protein [Candidatus Sungbacteria bacterium]
MPDALISKQNRPVINPSGWLSDILFLIGVISFFGSLIAAGGVFAYTKYLQKNNESLKEEIGKLETDLRPDILEQLLALDKKLGSLRTLLAAHAIPSNIFALLEQNTLSRVRFTSFSYAAESRKLELAGEAGTYFLLAQQVRTFESLSQIERVDFGGLSIGEKGLVSFRMSIIFKPALLRFQ